MSRKNSPPVTDPGKKETSVDPGASPCTSAPDMRCEALTAVRCWGISPGFFLPFLRLNILKGLPNRQERLSAVLRI